jgi:hypothetical protein
MPGGQVRPPQRHVAARGWFGLIWQGQNVILWGFFVGSGELVSLEWEGNFVMDGCTSFILCHEKNQEPVDLWCHADLSY